MNYITFKNHSYKEMNSEIYNRCVDIFDILDNIKTGEYCIYYDKYLFKTDKGMIAAYRDNISNYWFI